MGPLYRPSLSLCDRRVDALGAAVRRGADPFDDRIDLVAVRLCALQGFQGHEGQTFTEHSPVRVGGEGSTVTGLGERRGLAEAHIHKDVVHGVRPAGDHHVRVAEDQLVERHGQGREGARAGGVGDAVGAVEVQSVGDAPGDDVAEDAWEGALLPLGVVGGDVVAGFDDLALFEPKLTEAFDPDGSLQPADHGAEQLLGGGHSEDDRDLLAVQAIEVSLAGVLEDSLCHDESEELVRIGRRHDRRGYAEGHGVEVDIA